MRAETKPGIKVLRLNHTANKEGKGQTEINHSIIFFF